MIPLRFLSVFLVVAVAVRVLATPCEDELYLRLQEVDVTELSETDVFYVKTMEERCVFYRDSLVKAEIDSVKKAAREEKWTQKTKPMIIAGITMGALATFTMVVLAIAHGGVTVSVFGQEID